MAKATTDPRPAVKRDLKDELNKRFVNAKQMMKSVPPRIPPKGGGGRR